MVIVSQRRVFLDNASFPCQSLSTATSSDLSQGKGCIYRHLVIAVRDHENSGIHSCNPYLLRHALPRSSTSIGPFVTTDLLHSKIIKIDQCLY